MSNAVEIYRGPNAGQAVVPAFASRMSDPGGDRIDLRGLIALFRRRIGVFVSVFLIVLALGLLLTLLQTPTYVANAQVSLVAKTDQIAPTSTTDRQDQQPTIPSDAFVDTEVAIVTSASMAAQVAAALNLAADPHFSRPAPEHGLTAMFRRWLGLTKQMEVITPADARQNAIDYLRNGMTADRLGTTYALDLHFTDPDPEQATRIINEYARQYTSGNLTAKQSDNRATNALLARRLDDLRARAQADTATVQRYRIANNLLSTSGASLTEQEISSYNQAVATARADAAEDQARLATARTQLRQGSRGDDVGEALSSGVVGALRSKQAEVAGNLAVLTARYGPRHPDVIKAKSELASVDAQIESEIERVISNLAAKARVSQQRLGSLSGTLSGARGTLAQNNSAMVGLGDLQKRADTSQGLYESYLNRYKELSAREGTEKADAIVLAFAQQPDEPASPNVLLNMILSIALGLGLGLASAFIVEMTFAGITTGDDVEQRLGVKYLGSIPSLGSVTKRGMSKTPAAAIVDDPQSAFAEAFRALRASIAYANEGRAKVVAITSALPQEGKTTTAICLARSMALAGEQVVLVDCDLRRHGVSRFLRQEQPRAGLTEVLRGDASLDEALVRDEISGMSVLPVSAMAQSGAELLTGEEMTHLLDALRERYDMIIIDTAPILPIADARLILGKADLAMFVVRWRKTPDHAVRSALRLLPSDRVHLAGVALSRVNMRQQARFGYGDDSFYYREYKSYYA